MSLHFHEISESNHRILNPLSERKLALIGEICGLSSTTSALDLCCGKAEMLAGWSARYGLTAVGVDISEVFVEAAHRRIAELGVADRVTIVRQDAASWCRDDTRTYDIVSCIGATWIGGGLAGTVELLGPRVAAAGLLLIGECYRIDPTGPAGLPPAAESELAAVPRLVDVLDIAEAAGWELIEMVLADPDDWDRYVASQWQTVHDHVREHPEDSDADELRAWIAASQRDYLTWQRRSLGWGVFVLTRRLSRG